MTDMFTVVDLMWYDEADDSFTNIPPNVTLGEN